MFNHTLLSLIVKIVTTNASISPFDLLNVHKILFYIYVALPSAVLPAHQVILTSYKMKQMATGFILIAERVHWQYAKKESAEGSENMKLMVKLPSLLSSAMIWNLVSFLG